jgi:hypothetical protein
VLGLGKGDIHPYTEIVREIVLDFWVAKSGFIKGVGN